MKRISVIMLLMISALFAVDPQTVVDSLAHLDKLKHAQWSVYARYVDDPTQPVVSYNSDMSLACASSLKVITLAFALNELGPDFRFKTKLYYDGTLDEDAVLHGNIYIVGDGDPTLGGDQVGGVLHRERLLSVWAKSIRQAGIRSIDGSIVGDESLYPPYHAPGDWVWEDLGNYYGAGLTALCYCDNKYYLDFKPGPKVGDKAEVVSIRPEIQNLKYINEMMTGPKGSGDNGYIVNAPNQYSPVFHGSIPGDTDKFTIKGSIPNPALCVAQDLTQTLRKSGVSVDKDPWIKNNKTSYSSGILLKTVQSPPLKLITEITNKLSNNTYTEMLLLKIAHKRSGKGTTSQGVHEIEKYMDRLGVEHSGLDLMDASGLSRHNMITARIFADYLSAQTHEKHFKDFYNSFAVAGSDKDFGYVVYFCRNSSAAENARIKTGYIDGVRSHTGYVTSKSGRLIAFSCIANNYHCKTREITKLHEEVVKALAETE